MKVLRGKSLSDLLQTLRNHGVTEYVSPEVTIRFGTAAPGKAESKGVVADFGPAAGEDANETAEAEDFARELGAELDNFKYRLERGADRRKERKARA